MRRLAAMFGAALLSALGVILVIDRIGRSWESRVAVVGHSMEPTLRDGDWLLVDADAYRGRAPRAGELVVARDPRDPRRVLVKRTVSVALDGRVSITGDHVAHAEDRTRIGPVDTSAVIGRPWFRYWPADRVGKIH